MMFISWIYIEMHIEIHIEIYIEILTIPVILLQNNNTDIIT